MGAHLETLHPKTLYLQYFFQTIKENDPIIKNDLCNGPLPKKSALSLFQHFVHFIIRRTEKIAKVEVRKKRRMKEWYFLATVGILL